MNASASMLVLFAIAFAAIGKGTGGALPTIQPQEHASKAPKIVGGTAASPGMLPFQAELIIYSSGGTYLCGGTVISASFIATAAHCVTDAGQSGNGPVLLSGLSVGITVGQTALNYWPPITAANILVHANYSSATHLNDLALLYMSSPLTFSSTVQPLPLPPQGLVFPGGSYCIVSGWGETSYNGAISSTLLWAPVSVIDYATCSKSIGVAPTELCTSTTGTDACLGDSGGPVGCYDPSGNAYLAGIISYGYGCASGTPAVNTYVSAFTNLINSVMSNVLANGGTYRGTQFVATKQLRSLAGPASIVIPATGTAAAATAAGATSTANSNANRRDYSYTTSAARTNAPATTLAALVSATSASALLLAATLVAL